MALTTCTETSSQGLVVFAAQIATQAPLWHSLSWRAIGHTVSYANLLRSLVLPELLGSCPSSVRWDQSHTAVHRGTAEPSNRKLQKSVASGHDREPGKYSVSPIESTTLERYAKAMLDKYTSQFRCSSTVPLLFMSAASSVITCRSAGNIR